MIQLISVTKLLLTTSGSIDAQVAQLKLLSYQQNLTKFRLLFSLHTYVLFEWIIVYLATIEKKRKVETKRDKKQAHVFTETLAVVAAGEEEVAVQVKVVRGELRHPHDGLLAVVLDGVGARLLLGLPHQTFLQAGDDLALRVDVLHTHTRKRTDTHEGGFQSQHESLITHGHDGITMQNWF